MNRFSLTVILFCGLWPAISWSQPYIGPTSLCDDLETLVDELIPEDFPEISSKNATIEEIRGGKTYQKKAHKFLGAEHIYFDPESGANKKLLAYPLISSSKEEAAKVYIDLVKAFDSCELVYTSFADRPNPNVGILASQTIGIDRRFFNSKMTLYQYQSSDSARYWIEYELTAPK